MVRYDTRRKDLADSVGRSRYSSVGLGAVNRLQPLRSLPVRLEENELFTGLARSVVNNSAGRVPWTIAEVVDWLELASWQLRLSRPNNSPFGPDTWGTGE